MLGVHASGVCTGISARQEQIGRDVADGRRFRGKKLTSLPVQKHRGEQGHTHRDEHTVMKTRCPGHAGPVPIRGDGQKRPPPANPHNEPT